MENKLHYALQPRYKRKELNNILNAYSAMGGINLLYGACPFPNIDPPDIELCDILAYLTEKVKAPRLLTKKYDFAVYILLCDNSKIYVGYATERIEQDLDYPDMLKAMVLSRVKQHRSARGSNWTFIHPCVSLLFYFPGDKVDENLTTQLIVKSIGPDHVRGGKYHEGWTNIHERPSDPDFTDVPIDDIKTELFNRSCN